MSKKLLFTMTAVIFGLLFYTGAAKALICGEVPGTCEDGIPTGVEYNDTTDQYEWNCYGGGDSISCYGMDVPAAECGNGIIEEGEDCDGLNLGGKTCLNVTGVMGGTLSCSACSFDTSSCLVAQDDQDDGSGDNLMPDAEPAGDGSVHPDEMCKDGEPVYSEPTVFTFYLNEGNDLCTDCNYDMSWNSMLFGYEGTKQAPAKDDDGDGQYEFVDGINYCVDGIPVNPRTTRNAFDEIIFCWDCQGPDGYVRQGCCGQVDGITETPTNDGPVCATETTMIIDETGSFPSSQFCNSGTPTLSSSNYWYYCKPSLSDPNINDFGYCNDIAWNCSEGAEAAASCAGQAYVPYDMKDAFGFTTTYPINLK